MFPEITTLYLQHLGEQKERAFARWQASGYADVAAWAEFIRLFDAMIDHRFKVRRLALKAVTP